MVEGSLAGRIRRGAFQRRRRAVVALGLLLVAVGVGSASAKIRAPEASIDRTVRISAASDRLEVRGQITCIGCERFELAVTVTQRRTGALAQGGLRCVCRGEGSHWVIRAKVRNAGAFAPGGARACAWAVTYVGERRPDDAHQWCQDVKIVGA